MKKYLFSLFAVFILTLSVFAQSPSFTTDKTEYIIGETIKIDYENLESGMKLSFYTENNTPAGTEPAVRSTEAISGTGKTEFAIPLNIFEGVCTVYLTDADGVSVMSRKITLKYGATQRTMTVSKTSVTAGETISISYTGAESKDWFALYKKGQRPGMGGYYYTGGYVYASGSSGTVEFKIATENNDGTKLENGKYVLVLLKNNGYSPACSVELDVSVQYDEAEKHFTVNKNSFFPGDIMDIEYKNATSKDWIGLYPENVKPGSGINSLSWVYVTGSGSTRLAVPSGLSAGNYYIYMFANDGYSVLDKKNIVITARATGTPNSPSKITYQRDENAVHGLADGVITALPGSNITDGVILFWGDEKGVLEDYTFIGYAPYDGYENKYVYEITKSNIIPNGATKIYAFGTNGSKQDYIARKAAVSEDFVSCDIGTSSFKPSKLLYTFDVISDLHVSNGYGYPSFGENLTNNDRTALAFIDISKNNPESKGVMVAGDSVNYGAPAEYKMLGEIISEFIPDIPLYYSVGNHEFYFDGDTAEPQSGGNEHFAENWQRFRDFAGFDEDEFYRYMKIDGDYFVFMGTEDRSKENCPDTAYGYYSENQRNWLRGIQKEAEKNAANVFVFLHQSIDETVSGSYAWQNWDGVNDDEILREVIESYENTFLFTGHSHWNLNSYMPFINGGLDGANYFNTASAGYLWSDANVGVPGSEGLRVEVYEDYVLVRGRDFENGKWVTNVQTIVRTDDNPISARRNGNAVTVSINPYTDQNFTVIATVMEGGRTVSSKIVKKSDFVNGTLDIAVTEAQTVRAIAVSDTAALSPVCKSVEA